MHIHTATGRSVQQHGNVPTGRSVFAVGQERSVACFVTEQARQRVDINGREWLRNGGGRGRWRRRTEGNQTHNDCAPNEQRDARAAQKSFHFHRVYSVHSRAPWYTIWFMRQLKTQSTREKLLALALDLMEGPEGADGVTMRGVAASAGVTTMATYKHFQNRDALLRAATAAEYPRIAGYFARANARTEVPGLRGMLGYLNS